MNIYLIQERHLREWLADIIASGRRVVAPQHGDDGFANYRDVENVEAMMFHGAPKPDFSFKRLLFPQTEQLFRYHWDEGRLVVEDLSADERASAAAGEERDKREVVLFGAMPCDAASRLAFDHVFLADPPDPFYVRHRRNLTVIGLGCDHPQPECFCTSVGLSPVSTKGCDIFLTPLEMEVCNGVDSSPGYVTEILTKKGEMLLKNVEGEWIKPGRQEQKVYLEKLKAAREHKMRSEMLPRRELSPSPEAMKNDFENPIWEEIARTCLSCGVCAFVCPTCHCYDLTEERDGHIWSRCRNWDSCGYGYFTLHASGHNPRPTAMERYRQRAMHKFCYFLEATGANMCVGCGRCIKFCPVGLDIYQVRARWQ